MSEAAIIVRWRPSGQSRRTEQNHGMLLAGRSEGVNGSAGERQPDRSVCLIAQQNVCVCVMWEVKSSRDLASTDGMNE